MIPVRFHRSASRDLAEATAWYAARSPHVAHAFVAAIEAAIGQISSAPEAWPRRGARPDVRAYPLAQFPYAVVYRRRPTEIRILAIAHGQRDPEFWRRRT